MSATTEYRVVNADGSSPSMPYATLDEAQEAAQRRADRWPEDGPQVVQFRVLSEWGAVGETLEDCPKCKTRSVVCPLPAHIGCPYDDEPPSAEQERPA
jgi:hypothetical protein